MKREPFDQSISGPVLSRRFTCRLDDGWWLVERRPRSYHCVPLEGWRVAWWRFWVTVEATWWGFGTIRLTWGEITSSHRSIIGEGNPR